MQTKFISAPLKILLISFNSDLTKAFLNWLKLNPVSEFKFEVISSKKKLNELDLKPYYKAVWLISSQEVINFSENDLTTLTRINIPINLSVFYPAQVKLGNRKLDELKLYQAKLETALNLTREHLNQPQVFYGYEVVDPSLSAFSASSLVFFLKNIKNQVLVKPAGTVCYLLIDDFFKTLTEFLVKPHQAQTVVVRNTLAFKSGEVFFHFERLFSLYYKKDVLVKETNLVLENNLKRQNVVSVKSHFNKKIKLLVQGVGLKMGEIEEFVNLFNKLKVKTKQKKIAQLSTSATKPSQKTSTNAGTNKDIESIFSLDQEIIANLNKTRRLKKEKKLSKDIRLEIKAIKKNKRKKTLFYFGVGLISVGALSFILIVFYYFNLALVKSAFNKQLTAFLEDRGVELEDAQTVLSGLLNVQTRTYQSLVDVGVVSEASSVIEYQQKLKNYLNYKKELKNQGTMIVDSLFKGGNISLENLLSRLDETNRKLAQQLNDLIAGLETISLELNLTEGDAKRLKNKLKNNLRQAVILGQVSPLFNQLLGVNEEKRYALVYQDNNELRASGGVIKSVVILTFNHGKLVGYKVVNADEIDKNMGGEIELPVEIRENLKENSWHFVDAGWDSVDAGQKIAWFVEKATGQKIHGIVLVDNNFLAELLGLVGGVRLDQYNEFISKNNLDKKIIFYESLTEEKKQFQKDLLKAIFHQLVSADNISGLPSVLRNLLDSQHMVLSEFSPNEQKVFDHLLWGGGILRPACPSLFNNQVCQVDYLYQVESNTGLNKTNYFLTRQISHRVTLEPTQARHLREIKYHNLAKTNTWPKGDYQTYIRFYIPLNAEKIKVVSNGQDLPITIVKNKVNKKVSFRLGVPANSTKKIQLTFTTPIKQTNGLSWLFFDQNQPGTKSTPYKLVVVNKLGIKPKLVAPEAEIIDDRIVFTTYQDKNLLFALKF